MEPTDQTPKTNSPNEATSDERGGALGEDGERGEVQKDHVALALQYAEDVVAGRVVAGKLVRAACARQLADLERFAPHVEGAPFYWDDYEAGRICRFMELLPHVKGPKAKRKELISLEPWQCFILAVAFGWRRRDNGARRFRRVYIEVPRGNAKSTLSSGVGLYCLAADGEEGAEVYSAATDRTQARIVWKDAERMIRKRPGFFKKLGVEYSAHAITRQLSNGVFIPLSRNSGSMDGFNIHLAIIDELHAHKSREMYDVIETGTSKRESSLVWMITTAGSNTSGICYEVRGYVTKILDGVVSDDSVFGIVYSIDEGDRWNDPKVWAKANPNWGVSVFADNVADLCKKAMATPSAQANFKTKHLNVWVSASAPWIDIAAWDRCERHGLKVEDFADCEAFIGLDLASVDDLAAKALVFRREETRKGKVETHFYGFVTSYLPSDTVEESKNSQYRGWAETGSIKTTDGNVLDFDAVRLDVVEDAARFNVVECGFDPYQAQSLAQDIADEGITTVEVRPSVMNFSAPMKELETAIRSGRFHHNGDPCLRWQASNVVCKRDAKDNVYPRKEHPSNKIDGIVALIMAMARALVAVAAPNPYKTRGLRFLG